MLLLTFNKMIYLMVLHHNFESNKLFETIYDNNGPIPFTLKTYSAQTQSFKSKLCWIVQKKNDVIVQTECIKGSKIRLILPLFQNESFISFQRVEPNNLSKSLNL